MFDPELLEKRQALIASGVDPYPYSFSRSHTLGEAREKQADLLGKDVSVAGRLLAFRTAGKLVFADLGDADSRLQIMLRKNHFTEAQWDLIVRQLDLGDWLGVHGQLFVTRMGELTVEGRQYELLAKTVVRVPIPKSTEDRTYFQLADAETKYRERYLHWITDPAARQIIVTRAKIVSAIRRFLEGRGFIEVTTPTIEMSYGGAEARPFTTAIHALSNQSAYLRISPELPLKRFIAGGFEKVFTICQNFRNEGIDRSHNPEFTMLEWYEAYTDYHYQMEQFETLVSSVAREVTGGYKVTYQGTEIDFTPPWKRITVLGALRDAGVDLGSLGDGSLGDVELAAVLHAHGVQAPRPLSWGHAVAALFSELIEKTLVQPTFVCDHPVDISPLTKKKRGDDRLVERFEPAVAGMEIGNAYSELTDPVEQRDRFERQRALGADPEGVANHPVDEDFIKAVACGMPPTGGVGLGIDRLVMLLTDAHSIRDVIAFPMMKPR